MCFSIIKPTVDFIRDPDSKENLFAPHKIKPGERIPMEKKKNLWTDNEIEIVTLDDLKEAVLVDSCAFFYNTKEQKPMSDEVKAKLREALELLKENFTFRLTGNNEDKLLNYVSLIANEKEIYLPFKKFNTTVSEPKSSGNNPRSFGVVKGLFKNYDKLPGFARASNARDVEMVFGNNLTERVKLILIYTECGTEAIGPTTKFFPLGSVAFPLTLATKAKIPVINIGSIDAISKLKHFLANNQPVQNQETLSVQSEPEFSF